MNFLYDKSSLACVEDALNLLYRSSARLCTISCSNQEHNYVGVFCIRIAKLFYLMLEGDQTISESSCLVPTETTGELKFSQSHSRG